MPLAAARTELSALLRLALPLIASQLAHMLMVLTDTLMMARLSPEALAGGDHADAENRHERVTGRAEPAAGQGLGAEPGHHQGVGEYHQHMRQL
ncbi:MAG: hypothetical protein EOO78_30230, partial [Oxalobacteraceae bacterium]